MMTRVKVSPIDISEQLLIYDNICTKIHTRGVDLKYDLKYIYKGSRS
jgi:hypothetical protein